MNIKASLLKLDKNTLGRDFVIGDMHGHVSQLMSQLEGLNFNPLDDRVICVGDLIDRGPESEQALDLLDEPWFFAVLGNHEYLMLSGLKYGNSRDKMLWLQHGGDWITRADRSRWAHWFEQLEALPLAIEVVGHDGKRYGIIHADYPHAHWDELEYFTPELVQKSLWSRRHFEARANHVVKGIDYLIHGHSISDGELLLGNRFYIEPGAYLGNDFIIKQI